MELTILQSQVLEALAHCTATESSSRCTSFTTEDFTNYLYRKHRIRKEVHHLDPVMGRLKAMGLVSQVGYPDNSYSEWKLTESGKGLVGFK